MNSEVLVSGLLAYMVFLFSTTCHEAAHAFAAWIGGDPTAFEGGQVSLNPVPHIRREPFGMLLLPLLSLLTGTGMIGWASTPFNPNWARQFPRRAALMALAGPFTNFLLVVLSGLLLRVGTGSFARPDTFVYAILGIAFKMNVLLGIFNLIPFPPFDGFGALGLLTGGAGPLETMRAGLRQYSFLGLIIGWQLIRYIYPAALGVAIRVLL